MELEAIELVISREIVSEVRDVLTRPQIRQRFRALTDELIEEFVAALTKRAIIIPEAPRLFVFERDPKDEPYLNLAIAAEANYLVSRDTDILDLAKPDDADGIRLRSYAPNLRILDPVSFLNELRRIVEPVPRKK